MLRSFASVNVTAEGVASRRGFLKTLGIGATAAGAVSLSWRDMLLAKAPELAKNGKRMILLWMDGGPSQYDTFNPKPGSQYQGPTQPINTALPGVQIGEHWPKTAAVMAATQRPIALAAGGSPTTATAWKTIPSWYLLTLEDRAITPDAQRFMATRAGSTIVEVKSSHVAMLSHPAKVVDLIKTAVAATN